MKKKLVFLFCMLLLSAHPVYAQEPTHTGPPVIRTQVSDEPVVWAIAPCDDLYGYGHKAQITLISQDNLFREWFDDNGLLVYQVFKFKEAVNITALYPDGTFGKSVDLKLEFSGQYDGTTGISAMSGLRSAIVRPDGGLEAVNVGHMVYIADPDFGSVRGEVLSQSGRWDAVEGTRFDHIKYACDLVSD